MAHQARLCLIFRWQNQTPTSVRLLNYHWGASLHLVGGSRAAWSPRSLRAGATIQPKCAPTPAAERRRRRQHWQNEVRTIFKKSWNGSLFGDVSAGSVGKKKKSAAPEQMLFLSRWLRWQTPEFITSTFKESFRWIEKVSVVFLVFFGLFFLATVVNRVRNISRRLSSLILLADKGIKDWYQNLSVSGKHIKLFISITFNSSKI